MPPKPGTVMPNWKRRQPCGTIEIMQDGLRSLSLFELQLLVEVADLASLRAAARLLGLTPSHASKVLSRVEAKTGSRLFHRSAAGVTLTREGIAVKDAARDVLKAAEALDPSGRRAGEGDLILGIGSVSFLSHELLAPNLAGLAALEERLRIRLLDLPPDQILISGIRGMFELAVHVNRLEWPSRWTTTSLGETDWVLVSRSGHPLGRKATAEDVTAFPFIVPTYLKGDAFAVGNDFFPVPWHRRIKGHEASTASIAASIVRHTDQLAFLPRLVARTRMAEGQLQEIGVKGFQDFSLPVFLAVKADAVAARLHRRIAAVLAKFLEKS